MANKDELLFEVFEKLAAEHGGSVSRGGIFTSYHPRLKTKIGEREAALFFQKDTKDFYLCIRISGAFPFLLIIKPRYRSFGLFAIDLSFNAEKIEPSIPHPFLDHFIVRTDNVERCLKFINTDVFISHFQELLSPGVLEDQFYEEFRFPRRKDEGCADAFEDESTRVMDREQLEHDLERLPVPKRRSFFYPFIILDRRGAFLKVRFNHFHDLNMIKKQSSSQETESRHRKQLKAILSSYLDSLTHLLLAD